MGSVLRENLKIEIAIFESSQTRGELGRQMINMRNLISGLAREEIIR